MTRLVLDTNTIISGFLWKGNEFSLLEKAEKGEALLFLSKEILEEVENVINRPKFRELLRKANLTGEEIISKIVSFSHLIVGQSLSIRVCRDPKDDKFIKCAIQAKADYIVSGDRDLLDIGEYKEIKIAKTSEILRILENENPGATE